MIIHPSAITPASPADLEISVVVPALNEAKNLPELARRVASALAGRRYELIVVDDDSADGTPEIAARLCRDYPIRLIVRRDKSDGLSGAVLAGFAEARGSVLVVMDADLQHPPEKIPELAALIERGDAELAVGSRFVAGGRTAEGWGRFRRINSWFATALARPFAGRLRDPMSGFFALGRATLSRAERFAPTGYKIGLELVCKCRVTNVVEVPIHFDARAAGQSKLTLGQQCKYLDHVSRLYDFCFPRLAFIGKMAATTALGWLVGLAAYLVLLSADVRPGAAIPSAYLAALGASLVFHLRALRTQHVVAPTRFPWRDFLIGALAEFCACTATAIFLLGRGWRLHAGVLFLLTFAAAALARYAIRQRFMHDARGLRRAPNAA